MSTEVTMERIAENVAAFKAKSAGVCYFAHHNEANLPAAKVNFDVQEETWNHLLM
jgi:hypothetical protein